MALHPSDPGWADPDNEPNDNHSGDEDDAGGHDDEYVETSRGWFLLHNEENEDAWIACDPAGAAPVEDAPTDTDAVAMADDNDDAWLACDPEDAIVDPDATGPDPREGTTVVGDGDEWIAVDDDAFVEVER